MFEKITYQCPNCGAVVRHEIEDRQELDCFSCSRRYKVMLDKDTGKAGFIEVDRKEIPEPLFLPKGSVRAIVTIAIALTCWILFFVGKEVPSYLLSLLLAIIGYYFGFRMKVKAAESRIFDASARKEEPLFLPHGFIRIFLILGFFITGIVLLSKGRLKQLPYLEFFAILSGLILGYIFAKVFWSYEGSSLYMFVNHLKGLVVLGAAGYLAYLMLTGHYLVVYLKVCKFCVREREGCILPSKTKREV